LIRNADPILASFHLRSVSSANQPRWEGPEGSRKLARGKPSPTEVRW
jgi:hypothetical protein